MPDSVIDSTEDPWGIPAQSISWDVPIGTTVEGLITGQEMAQQTNFTGDGKPGKPLFWEDGRPRKKVIVHLECKPDENADEPDDGKRAMHVKIPSALFASIRKAIQEAGLKSLPVDRTHILAVTYTDDAEQTAAEKKAKRNPQKLYESLIVAAGDDFDSESPF